MAAFHSAVGSVIERTCAFPGAAGQKASAPEKKRAYRREVYDGFFQIILILQCHDTLLEMHLDI